MEKNTTWRARACSNIAIIKYMGKEDERKNLPLNSSLSFTLPHLWSEVELTESTNEGWEPWPGSNLELSARGLEKYLGHFQFLKKSWEIEGQYTIRSRNNFPADCGVASSASSFAALTQATYHLAQTRRSLELSYEDLAKFSRKGSGSSCRSFFPGWAEWKTDGHVRTVDLPQAMSHLLIIASDEVKKVSSSLAHRRVASSFLYKGRDKRAEQRLSEFLSAAKAHDWQKCYHLSWAEFWDMHALFETSEMPFGYMNKDSLAILEWLRETSENYGEYPLITMDAGANVHVLFWPHQASLHKSYRNSLSQLYPILSSIGTEGSDVV